MWFWKSIGQTKQNEYMKSNKYIKKIKNPIHLSSLEDIFPPSKSAKLRLIKGL